jgi:hypothetical protein
MKHLGTGHGEEERRLGGAVMGKGQEREAYGPGPTNACPFLSQTNRLNGLIPTHVTPFMRLKHRICTARRTNAPTNPRLSTMGLTR